MLRQIIDKQCIARSQSASASNASLCDCKANNVIALHACLNRALVLCREEVLQAQTCLSSSRRLLQWRLTLQERASAAPAQARGQREVRLLVAPGVVVGVALVVAVEAAGWDLAGTTPKAASDRATAAACAKLSLLSAPSGGTLNGL